eukprot:SAG11_NODE_89_length_17212_cov_3.812131_5_plen_108_part_00
MESSEADTVLPAAALLVPPLLAAPAPSSAKRQRRAPKRADDDLENMGQVTGGRAPKKSKAVGSGAAGGAAGVCHKAEPHSLHTRSHVRCPHRRQGAAARAKAARKAR